MIYDLWDSDVNRWHASRCHALRNSGDTTDAHAARCCRLLLAIKPDASANLIAATLHHDMAERLTGDNPWGAKMASKELRTVLVFLEERENARLGIGRMFKVLTDEEWAWIKLVDRLDAYLWCAMVAPRELDRDDWERACRDIFDRAAMLNVYQVVRDLIVECAGSK